MASHHGLTCFFEFRKHESPTWAVARVPAGAAVDSGKECVR